MPSNSRDDQLKEPNRFSFWRPGGHWDARHPGQFAAALALALWGSVFTFFLDSHCLDSKSAASASKFGTREGQSVLAKKWSFHRFPA